MYQRGARPFGLVKALAEEPVAVAVGILDAEIVARRQPSVLAHATIRRDALGPFRARATRCMARRQRKLSGGPSGTSVTGTSIGSGRENSLSGRSGARREGKNRRSLWGQPALFFPAVRRRQGRAMPRVRADGSRARRGISIAFRPRRARTRSEKSATSSPAVAVSPPRSACGVSTGADRKSRKAHEVEAVAGIERRRRARSAFRERACRSEPARAAAATRRPRCARPRRRPGKAAARRGVRLRPRRSRSRLRLLASRRISRSMSSMRPIGSARWRSTERGGDGQARRDDLLDLSQRLVEPEEQHGAEAAGKRRARALPRPRRPCAGRRFRGLRSYSAQA